jgi:hypothetical protein
MNQANMQEPSINPNPKFFNSSLRGSRQSSDLNHESKIEPKVSISFFNRDRALSFEGNSSPLHNQLASNFKNIFAPANNFMEVAQGS